MIRDGQQVSYIGMPRSDGLGISDRGQALAVAGKAAHVMWSTGARSGQVDLIDCDDLVGHGPGRVQGSVFDDSMSTAGLVTFAVRDTYEAEGPTGLLNAMNEMGHLASLPSIAEDALAYTCAQVRQDPSFTSVLAQLDESEAAEFVTLTATSMLRDAFGGDE